MVRNSRNVPLRQKLNLNNGEIVEKYEFDAVSTDGRLINIPSAQTIKNIGMTLYPCFVSPDIRILSLH